MMTQRLSRPRENSTTDNGRVFRNSKAFENKELCKANVFTSSDRMSPLKASQVSHLSPDQKDQSQFGNNSLLNKTEIKKYDGGKGSPRTEHKKDMNKLLIF